MTHNVSFCGLFIEVVEVHIDGAEGPVDIMQLVSGAVMSFVHQAILDGF
jgi:hypothetical protein